MAEATLITHAGAHRVTRPQLAGIIPPRSTASHRPIGHAELVDTLDIALARAGYAIGREQYAVQRAGLTLFGALDLVPNGIAAAPAEGTGLAFAFRHSNDKTMALWGVAGARVTICDNLALIGTTTVFRVVHKHGVMAALRQRLDQYFGAYDDQIATIRDRFGAWQQSPLTDVTAKALIFDAVYQGIIPSRLLDDVAGNYFRADDRGYPDCAPRTVWGLHNSFTRAFPALNPAPAFSAQLGLTRLLLDAERN